jgi:flagellin
MTSINTNVAAMAAVRSLSNISTDMGRTQQRIETGLRVGAANHDPAVFSISQRMRADISSMEAVRDGLSFGRATLGVARDAATSISNELNSLRKTVMQGLQDGIDAATINRQIQDSVTNIDTYARSATFNGVNLLVQAGDAALGVNDYDLRMPTDVNGRRLEVNTNPAGALRSTATALGVQGLEVANNAVRFTLPDAFNLDGSATAANVTTLTLQRSERINGANVNVDYVFEFKTAGTALQTTPDLDATGGMTKVFAVDLQAGETPLANIGRLLDTVRSQGFGATLENDGRILISSGGPERQRGRPQLRERQSGRRYGERCGRDGEREQQRRAVHDRHGDHQHGHATFGHRRGAAPGGGAAELQPAAHGLGEGGPGRPGGCRPRRGVRAAHQPADAPAARDAVPLDRQPAGPVAAQPVPLNGTGGAPRAPRRATHRPEGHVAA